MAIDINGNCVVFNGEALCSTPAGAEYNGVICHQGFCDTRLSPEQGGGTISGYTSGGNAPPIVDTIDKFPFAADANATDVGELTQGRYLTAGQSSNISGYTSAGAAANDTIDKFPFSADSPATDVGELTQGRLVGGGQSSDVSGYTSGGASPGVVNTIDKFPFSADSPASDVGELTQARLYGTGQQI